MDETVEALVGFFAAVDHLAEAAGTLTEVVTLEDDVMSAVALLVGHTELSKRTMKKQGVIE